MLSLFLNEEQTPIRLSPRIVRKNVWSIKRSTINWSAIHKNQNIYFLKIKTTMMCVCIEYGLCVVARDFYLCIFEIFGVHSYVYRNFEWMIQEYLYDWIGIDLLMFFNCFLRMICVLFTICWCCYSLNAVKLKLSFRKYEHTNALKKCLMKHRCLNGSAWCFFKFIKCQIMHRYLVDICLFLVMKNYQPYSHFYQINFDCIT